MTERSSGTAHRGAARPTTARGPLFRPAGEMALSPLFPEDRKRSATVTALTYCEVFVVKRHGPSGPSRRGHAPTASPPGESSFSGGLCAGAEGA